MSYWFIGRDLVNQANNKDVIAAACMWYWFIARELANQANKCTYMYTYQQKNIELHFFHVSLGMLYRKFAEHTTFVCKASLLILNHSQVDISIKALWQSTVTGMPYIILMRKSFDTAAAAPITAHPLCIFSMYGLSFSKFKHQSSKSTLEDADVVLKVKLT